MKKIKRNLHYTVCHWSGTDWLHNNIQSTLSDPLRPTQCGQIQSSERSHLSYSTHRCIMLTSGLLQKFNSNLHFVWLRDTLNHKSFFLSHYCVLWVFRCMYPSEVGQYMDAQQNASCLCLQLPMGLHIGRIPTVLPKWNDSGVSWSGTQCLCTQVQMEKQKKRGREKERWRKNEDGADTQTHSTHTFGTHTHMQDHTHQLWKISA